MKKLGFLFVALAAFFMVSCGESTADQIEALKSQLTQLQQEAAQMDKAQLDSTIQALTAQIEALSKKDTTVNEELNLMKNTISGLKKTEVEVVPVAAECDKACEKAAGECCKEGNGECCEEGNGECCEEKAVEVKEADAIKAEKTPVKGKVLPAAAAK